MIVDIENGQRFEKRYLTEEAVYEAFLPSAGASGSRSV